MYGQGWSYCNADTEKTELPPCTCKSRWANPVCNGSATFMSGCPSVESMQQCDPTFSEKSGQPWCTTNEDLCHEQEDSEDELMVGRGWAYCNPDRQEAELPECECQANWGPDQADCGNHGGEQLTFANCPSLEEISRCEPEFAAGVAQSWCRTTRSRCREQTWNVEHSSEDMV
jgi:hypothetical protein